MSPDKVKSPDALPWWKLLLLVGGCLFGVWLLFPENSRYIEDLVTDGSYEEAITRLQALSPAERAKRPAYFASLEIQARRLLIQSQGSAVDYEPVWNDAIALWRGANYDDAILPEMAQLIPLLRSPDASWDRLQNAAGDLPENTLRRLAAMFSNAALAANQSGAAAELYARAKPDGTRTPAESLQLSKLWHLAGDPARALTALGEQNGMGLTRQRVQLLRELNRNQEAFRILQSAVLSETTYQGEAERAAALREIGLAGGIPAAAVPSYQAYAATRPDDLDAQRNLRDLLAAANLTADALPIARRIVELSHDDPGDLRIAAQLHEYAGHPNQAFDYWLKLAKTGDGPALDRLVALNPGLYRESDLAVAYEAVLQAEGHDQHLLAAAQLEKYLGNYDQAAEFFTRYLNENRDDADTWRDVAEMQRELFDYREAIASYRQILALAPDDTATAVRLIDTLVLVGRPREALELGRSLANRQPPDQEALASYLKIAGSLGLYEESARSLHRLLQLSADTSAHDYQALAYTYSLAKRPDDQLTALREGLNRFPEDEPLRLQLAQILANRGQYREAQSVLSSHSGLHRDPAAAILYLELLAVNQDATNRALFLNKARAAAVEQNPRFKLLLAQARERDGDYRQAESIWRELISLESGNADYLSALAYNLLAQSRPAEAKQLVPRILAAATPESLRLAADVTFATRDYTESESYLLRYLAESTKVAPSDWGALGDVRTELKDTDGAKAAYTVALQQLLALAEPRTVETWTDERLAEAALRLPLADSRYANYLMQRLGREAAAEATSRGVLAQDPNDRPALITLGSIMQVQGKTSEVMRYARRLLQLDANDRDGLYLLAAGQIQERNFRAAQATLLTLRDQTPPQTRFPFQADLAFASYLAGDWPQARESYQALLRDYPLVPRDRLEIKQILLNLHRDHDRQFDFSASATLLSRSEVLRLEALHAAHLLTPHLWLKITGHRDTVTLRSAPGLRAGRWSRTDYLLDLTYDNWRGTQLNLVAGRQDDGNLGALEVKHDFSSGWTLGGRIDANERATDSLLLEAINGRQDSVEASMQASLTPRVQFSARANIRDVTARGEDVGSGRGVDLNLDYLVRPQYAVIIVGYRGSLAHFSPGTGSSDVTIPITDPAGGRPGRDAVFRNLVNPRINRHGLGFSITDVDEDVWLYRLNLGLDYDFELSSLGWNAGMYFAYTPRSWFELAGDLGYYSSATSSNAGSSAMQFNLLCRLYY
ncbi:MAG: tetratricopeptide repeat protein [Cephaloticoccus sp.]|nr:tetratricopeptide repeat protein [Cephaloticoccus sp.]